MPRNTLDFLLNALAPPTEEDLYTVVARATESQLERLLGAYGEYAKNSTPEIVPPLGRNEFRPYLPNDQRLAAWLLRGITLNLRSLDADESVWRAVDAIKYPLLYCHSVALDDLLSPLLTLMTGQLRLGDSQDARSARSGLLNYVQFLLHMRAHVRSHALCLLPPGFYANWRRNDNVNSFKQRLEQAVPSDAVWAELEIDEMVRAAPPRVRCLWEAQLQEGGSDEQLLRQVLFESACERISIAFTAAEQASGNLSPFLFRYDVRLLQACRAQALVGEGIRLDDRANRFLSTFIDIKLSGMDKIDPSSLADLRQDAGEFAAFRNSLSDIVGAVSALAPDLWNREQEAQRIAREGIEAARVRLEADFQKSPALKGLKKGGITLLGGVRLCGLGIFAEPARYGIRISGRLGGGRGKRKPLRRFWRRWIKALP